MSKIVRMQYPLDKTGTKPLYDGQVHYISPRRLRELNIGRNQFYVMEYFDSVANSNLITLLARDNNTLTKVPLDNYNVLFDFLNTHDLREVKIDNVSFPYEIGVTDIVDSYGLLSRYSEPEALSDSNGNNPPIPPNGVAGGNNPPEPPRVAVATSPPPTPPSGDPYDYDDSEKAPVAVAGSVPPNDPEDNIKPELNRKNIYLFTAVYIDDAGIVSQETYELDSVLDQHTLNERYLLKKHHESSKGEYITIGDSKEIDLDAINNALGSRYKYGVRYPYDTTCTYIYIDEYGNVKEADEYIEAGEYIYYGVACGVNSEEIINQMKKDPGLLIKPNWRVCPIMPTPDVEFYNGCNGTTPMFTIDSHGNENEIVQPLVSTLK